jgi:hypothetical protein
MRPRRRPGGEIVLGLYLHVENASIECDVDTAFARFIEQRVNALFVVGDAFFVTRRDQLAPLGGPRLSPRPWPCSPPYDDKRVDDKRGQSVEEQVSTSEPASKRAVCLRSGVDLASPHVGRQRMELEISSRNGHEIPGEHQERAAVRVQRLMRPELPQFRMRPDKAHCSGSGPISDVDLQR